MPAAIPMGIDEFQIPTIRARFFSEYKAEIMAVPPGA
jgi:hypothetical protein